MATNQSKKNAGVETSLVLRVCRAEHTSHNGFVWPAEVGAEVAAPDWEGDTNCGHGLHGWLYGQGDYSCVDFWRDPDAKWYVLEVPTSSLTELGGKYKFPRAVVRFIGSRGDAADYIIANEPKALNVAVIGASRRVGNKEFVQVGAFGTAEAGYSGTAEAGDYGTAEAGDSGTAKAGDSGTAKAGNYGTAEAGNYGTAEAGDEGEIRIRWWDSKARRYRTKIGYVGEDGIKANTPYHLDDNHEFKKVPE